MLWLFRRNIQEQAHQKLYKSPIDDTATNNLGEFIREKRYEKAFNRRELSLKTGLTTEHLAALENGRILSIDIQSEWLEKIASGLNLSPDDLKNKIKEQDNITTNDSVSKINNTQGKGHKWVIRTFIGIGILIAGLLTYQGVGGANLLNLFPLPPTHTPSAVAEMILPTKTPSATPTLTNTPTFTPASTETPTQTPSETPAITPSLTPSSTGLAPIVPSPSLTPTITATPPPRCQVTSPYNSINIWSGPGGIRPDDSIIYNNFAWAKTDTVFRVLEVTEDDQNFKIRIAQWHIDNDRVGANPGYSPPQAGDVGWVFASSCPRSNETQAEIVQNIPPTVTFTPTPTPTPTPTIMFTFSQSPDGDVYEISWNILNVSEAYIARRSSSQGQYSRYLTIPLNNNGAGSDSIGAARFYDYRLRVVLLNGTNAFRYICADGYSFIQNGTTPCP